MVHRVITRSNRREVRGTWAEYQETLLERKTDLSCGDILEALCCAIGNWEAFIHEHKGLVVNFQSSLAFRF